ncbi:endophilin-A3-like [Sinocyclocheilus rhinocerous]|uniref:endophilin-A3-like n=1 Tax=Sinocyclocheilus rhinocerous TaxID=307959 RepID=UPI0007B8CEA2|nr:PREDICTED: endophilin-A3-like [Sinocyclocheilus rhinocerous]
MRLSANHNPQIKHNRPALVSEGEKNPPRNAGYFASGGEINRKRFRYRVLCSFEGLNHHFCLLNIFYSSPFAFRLILRMSVAGFKKQLHKASQLLREKISGAEGTKLDEDFMEMERKIEVTNKSVFELITKTTEYLQPNPASRAKLGMLNTVSKIRGQVKTTGYPQTEGLLGDCMLRYGRELGEESTFGAALVDIGEAMKQMADIKDALDINVKQNFIDPLQTLQDKDLKEIVHHLKKLEGRRLDFDYVEQVSQLSALIEAALDYHRQSLEILKELDSKLQNRISTASSRPKKEFKPKLIVSSLETVETRQHNGLTHTSSVKSTELESHLDQPCCRSLYDFDPENEGELGFKEGDVIILTNQIDENWYEGMINGESGFFPINYVEVLVPLPQ